MKRIAIAVCVLSAGLAACGSSGSAPQAVSTFTSSPQYIHAKAQFNKCLKTTTPTSKTKAQEFVACAMPGATPQDKKDAENCLVKDAIAQHFGLGTTKAKREQRRGTMLTNGITCVTTFKSTPSASPKATASASPKAS
jgi:hypothetical protein